MSAFDAMREAGGARCLLLADEKIGLRAVVAIDSLVLGPAAGGIRTAFYNREEDAIADAVRLAAAMTLKCAIAGLDAGGAKTVMMQNALIDRPAAFRRLGAFIEELKGLYFSAGDLGTSEADLCEVARETGYVSVEGSKLAEAAGRGVLRCVEACADIRRRDVADLRIAVQGCGAMGAAVARSLAAAGASVLVADADPARAADLAREIDADVCDAGAVLAANVDVVAPCAIGGVLTTQSIDSMRAWAICGAANNQIADTAASERLMRRDILYVPDFLASSGAVIQGMSRAPDEANRLTDALRETASAVLRQALLTRRPTAEIARQIALTRISRARNG